MYSEESLIHSIFYEVGTDNNHGGGNDGGNGDDLGWCKFQTDWFNQIKADIDKSVKWTGR